MYLSGENISSIVKMYGIMSGCEIIDTLDSIKAELSTADINTRKLNKAKAKLGRLHGRCNALYNKQLKHEERARHFKAKMLVLEQSIPELHACIDKLKTV